MVPDRFDVWGPQIYSIHWVMKWRVGTGEVGRIILQSVKGGILLGEFWALGLLSAVMHLI